MRQDLSAARCSNIEHIITSRFGSCDKIIDSYCRKSGISKTYIDSISAIRGYLNQGYSLSDIIELAS